MIGLFVVKVFQNIIFLVTHSLCGSFYHFLHYISPKKRFSHHSKLRLSTAKEFFLVESIKICDDFKNESQYLCLQLNYLNQIKCHKNHFLYLKLILLLAGDISLNPGPTQNDHLKENRKIFKTGACILYIWI